MSLCYWPFCYIVTVYSLVDHKVAIENGWRWWQQKPTFLRKQPPFFHCLHVSLSHLSFDLFHLNLQRAKTPELVPESAEPMRSGVPKTVKATQKLLSIWNIIKDYLTDPRMGPTLLLGALLSAGNVWWARSRSTQPPVPTNQPSSNQSDDNVTMKCFSSDWSKYISQFLT